MAHLMNNALRILGCWLVIVASTVEGLHAAPSVLTARRRGVAVAGPVAFTAATSGNTGATTATSLTFAFTVSACTNCVLVVASDLRCSSPCTPAVSATYNGAALTSHGQIIQPSSTDSVSTLLYRVNPDVGTHNVVISHISGRSIGGAFLFQNVHQATPLGTAVTDGGAGTDTAISCSITIPTDGMGVASANKQNSTEALNTNTGTQRYNNQTTDAAASNIIGAGATHGTAGVFAFTWSFTAGRTNSAICAPVNPL